ncbi:acetolactate synthase small subunit [Anaeromicropila populeti]|uniref:Acetolactate synthase small subunit n=1 Tax=Anaeromicropila populeti TaxID=37658 RepID=A0A1I6J1J8_9FIRM|nr:acetolactate synthase small subunit [Anaeromicropila populeti]SFR72833.1 acetolactate synthase, small subunit [Anaeromicropila populeti]
MKKRRWLSLFVENDIGVLARISGLFSSKSYNIETLTVGTTEDPSISRMTISVISDENTIELIKKQLNRCVEVIKVMDFTETPIHVKEILFIKIKNCSKEDKIEIFRIAQAFKLGVTDYGTDSVLIECVNTENRNNDIIRLFQENFLKIEVVRGGNVAIEAISLSDQ